MLLAPVAAKEISTCSRHFALPRWPRRSLPCCSPKPVRRPRPEFRAPVETWTPVISASGALFYDGAMFPWKGDLIAGGLSSQAIIRLTLDGGKVKNEERLNMGRRMRDVLQAPDGAILAVTDDKQGELLRLLRPREALGSHEKALLYLEMHGFIGYACARR
jgi:glucose/arabinose dehydrogenase